MEDNFLQASFGNKQSNEDYRKKTAKKEKEQKGKDILYIILLLLIITAIILMLYFLLRHKQHNNDTEEHNNNTEEPQLPKEPKLQQKSKQQTEQPMLTWKSTLDNTNYSLNITSIDLYYVKEGNIDTYVPLPDDIINYYSEQGILHEHQSTGIDSSHARINEGYYNITYDDGTTLRQFYNRDDGAWAGYFDGHEYNFADGTRTTFNNLEYGHGSDEAGTFIRIVDDKNRTYILTSERYKDVALLGNNSKSIKTMYTKKTKKINNDELKPKTITKTFCKC